MLPEKELKQNLKNRKVLFDTNILIKAFEYPYAFKDILTKLNQFNCQLVDFELINFEFTRNFYDPQHLKLREDFLNKLTLIKLNFKPSLIQEAIKIARLYSFKKIQKGQISFIDCCIAAYLKQYPEELFLMTLNHSDFPVVIFDRLYIFPVDYRNEVLAPAIYRINLKKFKQIESILNSTFNMAN